MYQSRVEFTQQPVFKHRQLHVLLLIRSSDHGQIASIDNPRLLETGPPLAEGRKTQLKGKLDIQLSLDPPKIRARMSGTHSALYWEDLKM